MTLFRANKWTWGLVALLFCGGVGLAVRPHLSNSGTADSHSVESDSMSVANEARLAEHGRFPANERGMKGLDDASLALRIQKSDGSLCTTLPRVIRIDAEPNEDLDVRASGRAGIVEIASSDTDVQIVVECEFERSLPILIRAHQSGLIYIYLFPFEEENDTRAVVTGRVIGDLIVEQMYVCIAMLPAKEAGPWAENLDWPGPIVWQRGSTSTIDSNGHWSIATTLPQVPTSVLWRAEVWWNPLDSSGLMEAVPIALTSPFALSGGQEYDLGVIHVPAPIVVRAHVDRAMLAGRRATHATWDMHLLEPASPLQGTARLLQSGSCKADGSLNMILPGIYAEGRALVVVHDGDVWLPSKDFILVQGINDLGVLTFPATACLTGTVVDATHSSDRIENGYAMLYPTAPLNDIPVAELALGPCEAEVHGGEFVFPRVAPYEYRLEVRIETSTSTMTVGKLDSIRLQAGETTHCNISISMPSIILRGRIIRPEGLQNTFEPVVRIFTQGNGKTGSIGYVGESVDIEVTSEAQVWAKVSPFDSAYDEPYVVLTGTWNPAAAPTPDIVIQEYPSVLSVMAPSGSSSSVAILTCKAPIGSSLGAPPESFSAVRVHLPDAGGNRTIRGLPPGRYHCTIISELGELLKEYDIDVQ